MDSLRGDENVGKVGVTVLILLSFFFLVFVRR
jgi:hypothetical protein